MRLQVSMQLRQKRRTSEVVTGAPPLGSRSDLDVRSARGAEEPLGRLSLTDYVALMLDCEVVAQSLFQTEYCEMPADERPEPELPNRTRCANAPRRVRIRS